MTKPNRQLPIMVKQICLWHEGYLVGSGVPYLLGETGVNNDWDVIIEPNNWERFLPFMLDKQFTLNSWGGFKIWDGDNEIDVWPNSLHDYIKSPKASKKIYKPHGGQFITII